MSPTPQGGNRTALIGSGIIRPTTDSPEKIQDNVSPSLPSQPLENPREAAKWSRLRLRYFTPSGTGVDVPVGGAVSSLAVTFARQESNTEYGVHVTPSWDTTVWVDVTDKLTTGFTVNFGSASPGGGGVIQWATFRSEDTP